MMYHFFEAGEAAQEGKPVDFVGYPGSLVSLL